MLSELAAMQHDEKAARHRDRRAAVRSRMGVDRPGDLVWAVCVSFGALALAWGVATPRGLIAEIAVERVLVRVLAVVVSLGAVWVWAHSIRTRRAEAAVSAAALAVVAGTTVPLDRTAGAVGTAWALAAATPLVVGSSWRWPKRRWCAYSAMTMVIGGGLAASVSLTGVALPTGPHPPVAALAAAVVGGSTLWSTRELRLYRIGRAPASLGAAIALGILGLASAATLLDERTSGRLQPSVGLVVIAAGAALVATSWAYRLPGAVVRLLEPVSRRWPLAVVELGTAPVVERAAWRLDLRDRELRDRSIRITDLALAVAERLGLEPNGLRNLAVAALLHDIGMLDVPEAIRTSAHPLDDSDREAVHRHAIDGAEMLAPVPPLAEAARFVRAHHERVDGTGYPDRLAGNRVPLESRIIAVCDAYDALTHANTRRGGTGHSWALEVLRQHAGAQWDAAAVEALIAVTATEAAVAPPDVVVIAGSGAARPSDDAAATDSKPQLSVDDAWRLFASDLLREPPHRQQDEHPQDRH